jgi:glycosyltransferase involved in cell wall biosynthesis
LLQKALFAVVPSRLWEGLPLVVAEHFAAGLPVIATNVPGLGDLIEPGRTGLVVSAESREEMAAALAQLFRDPADTRRMGQAAKGLTRDFHWDGIARRHIALFEELIAARAKKFAS